MDFSPFSLVEHEDGEASLLLSEFPETESRILM